MGFDKTPCASYGVQTGGTTDTCFTIRLSGEKPHYGVAKGDPTHTFDMLRFESLKAHLGQPGYPRTAREAQVMALKPRAKVNA